MDASSKQFGTMVAYLLPGFIVLAGIAPFAPIVAAWLKPLDQAEASLGAPLYALLAALTIGMIVSCCGTTQYDLTAAGLIFPSVDGMWHM